jgi:hypothetical protein
MDRVVGIFQQAANSISSAVNAIPGKFQEGINSLWNTVGSLGGHMWNSFTSAFGGLGGTIRDHFNWAFNQMNPANLLEKAFRFDGRGKGRLEGLLNIDVPFANFADGGMVPGQASVPGDNIKNDTVAAFLSPGEAVIPRSIMSDPRMARIVEAMLDGSLEFNFGGKLKPPVKVSAPKISAPKLPSASDITKLSTADLQNALETNLGALQALSFNDLWKNFSDKVANETVKGLESMIKHNMGGFAEGGPVTSGGITQVHSGEFVMNEGMLGGLANAITGAQQPQGGGDVVLNATVNMVGDGGGQGKVSGKKIIDEMFVELRKRSANQKVLHRSGLI